MTAPEVPGRNPRWMQAALTMATAGALLGAVAVAAAVVELVSNRHLPRGWVRYQPPWTVPVLVIGLVLVGVASLVSGGVVIARARSRGQV
jgi:hypothetical protein